MSQPRIALIYLSYHSEPYLDRFVDSIKKLTYQKDRLALVIVDNPHLEHGSSESALRTKIESLSDCALHQIIILPQQTNLGFAGGNNVGIKWALDHGYDYVYLHNQDGFLAPDALQPLVEAMARNNTIAVAQSLLLMYPEKHLLNNAGNSFHYLGFGFCREYRKPLAESASLQVCKSASNNLPTCQLANLETSINIPYASGAASLIHAEVIKQYGLLDEDFFMYHEDTEWCFRFRMSGMRIVLVPDSKFYHEYKFSRSMEKYYYMERNRYGVLLMFYKWPTLILILPMFVVMEIGLWFFAWRGGWLDKRIKVFQYWRRRENIRVWLAKRRRIQKMRTISDRDILKISSPGIYFQEKEVENWLLTYVANPVMTLYYWILRFFIFW